MAPQPSNHERRSPKWKNLNRSRYLHIVVIVSYTSFGQQLNPGWGMYNQARGFLWWRFEVLLLKGSETACSTLDEYGLREHLLW